MPLFLFIVMTNELSTINPANAGSIGGFASVHETGRVSFSMVAARRTVKEVFNALRLAYMKVAHKVSLCSTALFSFLFMLEVPVSVPAIAVLAVVVIASSMVSFFYIYNNVMQEEE